MIRVLFVVHIYRWFTRGNSVIPEIIVGKKVLFLLVEKNYYNVFSLSQWKR